MEKEKDLNELVEKLKQAAGANLRSVVLYGSAVAGDYHPKHSNLNVLCVLGNLEPAEIAKLRSAARWWEGKGHPVPLVFTAEELHHAADVFAIELVDIQEHRRVLFGEDFFATLEVPLRLHRVQVERELRHGLVRLRERYLASPGDPKSLVALMTASVSSFATLFRHAALALAPASSSPRPPGAEGKDRGRKRDAVDGLAALLGFDAAPFHAILDVREGKRASKEVDAEATFREYLQGVTRVVQEVDRRLAQEQ
ncbi:MAG TPA: hypothetical protein VGW33_05195 [Terriglobia bacterium]|nr:hypothetical protein [Terriglobia bacterium]